MYEEYKIDESSFIGGWYIPENCCNELLETYKSNKTKWINGIIGCDDSSNDKIKKSTEFIIESHNHNLYLKNYLHHLNNVLENYKKRFPYCDKGVNGLAIYQNVKIQHYKPGEGYYQWHCENGGFKEFRIRHLAFMTYLNTIENGGTEFYHQNLITPAKKGLTLIWPSQWTHTHKGQISSTKDKYIITGWFNYNE